MVITFSGSLSAFSSCLTRGCGCVSQHCDRFQDELTPPETRCLNRCCLIWSQTDENYLVALWLWSSKFIQHSFGQDFNQLDCLETADFKT